MFFCMESEGDRCEQLAPSQVRQLLYHEMLLNAPLAFGLSESATEKARLAAFATYGYVRWTADNLGGAPGSN